MPENPTITDIRSWFGLINQLAPFLLKNTLMTPFSDLLKPTRTSGTKVYWDSELKAKFEETKLAICEIAEKELAYYDTRRETAVITDWSKQGIGYVILQKHCTCTGDINPLCCENGWRLAFCNSHSLTTEESNYAPIEGEGLAITWALKKSRMFLLGNPKFMFFVDHQPLLKIFGEKSLVGIDNPRLLHQKEKILSYNFDIKFIKGLKNSRVILLVNQIKTMF